MELLVLRQLLLLGPELLKFLRLLLVLLVLDLVLGLDLFELVTEEVLLPLGGYLLLVGCVQLVLKLGALLTKGLHLVADVLELGSRLV